MANDNGTKTKRNPTRSSDFTFKASKGCCQHKLAQPFDFFGGMVLCAVIIFAMVFQLLHLLFFFPIAGLLHAIQRISQSDPGL